MAGPPQPPAAGARPPRCLNCEAPLHGEHCSACGQGHARPRLALRDVAAAVLEQLIDLDLPIFRTVGGLSVRPGGVCRDYVEGRRRRYTNPLKYCFLTVTILAVVIAAFDLSVSDLIITGGRGAPGAPASGERAGGFGNPLEHGRRVELVINYLAFASVPVVAAVLLALFPAARLNYAEHYAAALFIFGHVFLINVVTLLLGASRHLWVLAIQELIQLAYLGWALRGFYGVSTLRAAGSALVVDLLYYVVTTVLGAMVVTATIIAGSAGGGSP